MTELNKSATRLFGNLIARNAPLLTLLVAYLLLTVLMNVVFLYDDSAADESVRPFSILDFPIQTVGYWVLLFLPFAVLPPIALFVRRLFQRSAKAAIVAVPEFRLLDYLFITGICYLVVSVAMYRADALELLLQGVDGASSVAARFDVLGRLHLLERAVLQSVLVFLTLYSLVRAIRSRSLLWLLIFAVNLVAMAALLVLLNMKWPIVVLFGGVVAAIALVGERRRIYLPIGVFGMVCVYMLVATVLLRLPQPGAPSQRPDHANTSMSPNSIVAKLQGTVETAIFASPKLAVTGLVRMAIPYPFYYRTFTDEGQVCGSLLDRVMRRPSPCLPSVLIYERMFKNDGFAGRGTAPAPFHVTGYALDSWFGAIVECVLTAIVIGAFMAVPVKQSSISSTIAVMGILSAYFFSQLPFEGAVVYDHGFVWWALLVAGYALLRRLVGKVQSRQVPIVRHELGSRE